MTSLERKARASAIGRLAVATRERVEPALFEVYVESTSAVPVEVLVRACDRLSRTSQWFPKVAEILEDCRAVARADQERREATQRRLTDGNQPVSDEKHRELMHGLVSLVRSKRFPQ